MISALAWVRRGAAARVPRTEGALDEGALESVIPGSGAWEDKPAAVAASSSSGKRRAGGDDDDDSDDDEFRLQRLTAGNLMHHKSNKDDPNMQMREEDDDDSELDDFEIGETDLVLLGARSDEQLSSLEAYIYEEPADNLYPHHDVPLPVFPLCVAWFDFQPGGGSGSGARGNFAAVGTFAPYIEVWDLDVMDALEPCVVIGAEAAARVADEEVTSHAAEALMASSKQKHGSHAVARAEGKQKGKKKKVLGGEGSGPQGHRDAVMCLAWNTMQPNALASGSADHTVRLWDLEGDCAGSVATLSHHRDKVQHMVWHPADATSLLTAGFDKRSVLVDVRTPDGAAREWGLTADAEKVAWHPSGTSFAVSTEDGLVQSFDTRAGATTAPLWKLQAHTQACAGLDFNHHVDGLLATGGQDKVVKLWTLDGSGGVPTLLAKRNLQLGAIFDISWCKDSPALLAAGGSKGKLGIWNTLELEEVQAKLPGALAALGDDGRVLSGAVAGIGALDVNSTDDEDDEADDEPRANKGAKAKKKTTTAFAPVAKEDDDDDDDDDDDEEDEEDDDDEEGEVVVVEEDDSAAKQRAKVAARVAAAAEAASKPARRGKAKFGKVKVGKR